MNIKNFKNKKAKPSRYAISIFTLASGTAIAQALPIAVAPVLTRLYSPSDFGLLALYMSIVSILGIAATWRYELAIILPEQDKDADELVIISFWASIITSVLSFIVIVCFHSTIASLLGNRDIEPWLYLTPVSILFLGVYNTLNYWLNRHERYLAMSYSRITLSGIGSGSSIALGCLHIGTAGLILGKLLGQISSVLFITKIFLQRGHYNFFANLQKKFSLIKEYRRHPAHLLPSHIVGTIATQLPVLLISGFFGASITGFYSLAQRMISLPSSLIANAIGDVYRQQASVAYNKNGEFRDLFVSTLTRSFVLAIVPFSILFIIAPDIFSFVFGENWRVAGEYARILIVGAFFQFVYAPVDKGALIVGATRYIFYWHLGRLLGFGIMAAFIFWHHLTVKQVLWFIISINSSLYLIDIWIGYKFSLGALKS